MGATEENVVVTSQRSESSHKSNISVEEIDKIVSATIYTWKIMKEKHKSPYTVYCIEVINNKGKRWSVERRYREFRTLRQIFIDEQVLPDIKGISFPRKNYLLNRATNRERKQRQIALNQYLLDTICKLQSPCSG